MGNKLGAVGGASKATSAASEEDWPWVWAIRDPEQLDWKRGLEDEPEVLARISKQQSPLPVPLDLFAGDDNQRALTVPSASREKSFLWLGDAACARHAARLRHDIGITHIVNCADACNHHYDLNQTYADLGITVLRLEAEDEPGFPMLAKYLDRVQRFVADAESQEESTKVMIHCTAGINRSGVLVAALVMLKYRISVLDTVRHIRRRRGNSFLWNETFQEDLVALARTHGLLGDTPTGAPAMPPLSKGPTKTVRDLF